MSLNDKERDTIVCLQLQKAMKNLEQADNLCSMAYWDLAANRYYYACYHALQALLINNGLSCHTHSGLIASFGMHFVKTGKIDASFGRFVSRLEQLRERSDYNCSYEISKDEILTIKEPARQLIRRIKEMVNANV